MADKIVVMHDGIVEQIGAPLDLYDRPANLFVAGFIGSPAMNMIKGRLDPENGNQFIAADGTRSAGRKSASRRKGARPHLWPASGIYRARRRTACRRKSR